MKQRSNGGDRWWVLITFHGTIVNFDPVTRRLRHDAIGSRAANVLATRDGADTILFWRDGDMVRPLGRYGRDFCTFPIDDNPGVLTEEPAARDLIALSCDGRYLCAEHDGTIAFSRLEALDWERFLVIDGDDLARVEFVLANRWFSRLTGALVEPESCRCVEPYTIQFGQTQVRIADIVHAARATATKTMMPRDLFLTCDGWRVEHYVLFRPLAYFVAYGGDEIFQCAELAIQSLFAFGDWDGEVLVITDAGNIGFAERLPVEIRGRINVVPLPANDILDYTLARYKIADLGIREIYQPVIYMDTDIVCDAPVRTVLQAIAASGDLQAWPEFPLGHPGDYYGQSLLEAERIAYDRNQSGFSSGIFAFRDIEEQRRLFSTIVDTAYRIAGLTGRRDAFEYYDQPMFNYVLFKTKQVIGAILKEAVELHLNHFPMLTIPVRKGFVHFAGGVGNATPKLTHMKAYVEMLAREKIGLAALSSEFAAQRG